jgi:hypothetical protein
MRTLTIATTTALAFLATATAAQEAPATGGSAIGGLFEALGLRKPPPPAPDFVRESRPAPDQLNYEPMKPKPASEPKKNVEQLSAAGPALERAAAEARRRASRVKSPN